MDNTSSVLRFILDDNIVEIDFSKYDAPSPTTTVLKYLRSLQGHMGVKEGCSVGDCGACTVVLGELVDGKLSYRAITSCLSFLPALHGKQLITIENLSYKKENKTYLHPLQEAMIELHGTQCGYCTPGIIMSLFSMYKNIDNPDRKDIEIALTGNLCRCTGYQPIIEAAEKACAEKMEDIFSKKADDTIKMLKEIHQNNDTLDIETAGVKYFKPSNIEEALKLRLHYPKATIVSGATDLSPQHNRFKAKFTKILDISDVPELKLHSHDNENFYMGAGITVENLYKLSSDTLPALHEICELFGSTQIRNLATIGGNIASASPIGDLLPLLFVYQAQIETRSLKNTRLTPIEDFIEGYRKTSLQKDEIISKIIIPKINKNIIVKVYKLSKRKDLDISTLSAAFKLKLNNNNETEEIMIVYGGMAEAPKRALKTESSLKGKRWNRENIEEAMNIIDQEFNPISDVRSDDKTRKLGARNLLLKFWVNISQS